MTQEEGVAFKLTRDELKTLQKSRNTTLLQHVGGVLFIVRALKSDPIQGISHVQKKQTHSSLMSSLKNISFGSKKFFSSGKDLTDQKSEELVDYNNRLKYFGTNTLNSNAPMKQVVSLKSKTTDTINKEQAEFQSKAIRNERKKIIKWADIVVGDIILLERGCLIPADGLLIDGENLEVDEGLYDSITIKGERSNDLSISKKSSSSPFLFARTHVVRGRGRMIVTSVGRTSALSSMIHSLQYALYYGAMDRAKLLLKLGVSPDTPAGRDGYMLVHYIARYGDIKQISLLIQYNVNINTQTIIHGYTALDLAISHNKELVDVLLGCKNIDTNIRDHRGRNALFHAVKYGDWNLVKKLAEDFKTDTTTLDHSGWSLLHYATIYSSDSLCIDLIESGHVSSLVNLQDIDGNTALIYACIAGRSGVAEALVRHGADVNVKNNVGKSCVHYVVMGDTNPFFIYHGRHRYLIMNCGDRKIPALRKLSSSISTKIRKERFQIPGAITLVNLKSTLVRLISLGADINAIDMGGLRPIHYCICAARFDKNEEIADLLRSRFKSQFTSSLFLPRSSSAPEFTTPRNEKSNESPKTEDEEGRAEEEKIGIGASSYAENLSRCREISQIKFKKRNRPFLEKRNTQHLIALEESSKHNFFKEVIEILSLQGVITECSSQVSKEILP